MAEICTLLSETGIDAIELNFYQVPTDFNKSAAEIEEEQINILKQIKKTLLSLSASSLVPTIRIF